jgi:hypothetical protein
MRWRSWAQSNVTQHGLRQEPAKFGARIALRSNQSRWKQLLADLRSDTAARQDLDPATRTQMVRELRYAINEVNTEWAALSRIEVEFAANRTGRTAEMSLTAMSFPTI